MAALGKCPVCGGKTLYTYKDGRTTCYRCIGLRKSMHKLKHVEARSASGYMKITRPSECGRRLRALNPKITDNWAEVTCEACLKRKPAPENAPVAAVDKKVE